MTAWHPGVNEADAPAPSASLPVELTIYTASEAHTAMCAWKADGPALQVDAAAVAEIDSAGVQLLIALARPAALRGQPLVLAQPTPALAAICRRPGAGFLLEPAAEPEAAA
jgi:anti-anti-sigma regulatory factor